MLLNGNRKYSRTTAAALSSFTLSKVTRIGIRQREGYLTGQMGGFFDRCRGMKGVAGWQEWVSETVSQ
jgi:hypothetical protein